MKKPETPPLEFPGYECGELLKELMEVGKFYEFFQINNDKYPYWDKWKYIAKEWNLDPQKLWSAVKTIRQGERLRFALLPDFKINVPSVIQKYLHEFDLNLGGSLMGESIIPAEEKEKYLISSLMEEAIASSQLEGAVTTRKLAKEMLEENRKPRNNSEQMILNNYEAMLWIVDNKSEPVTAKNILHIHSIISKGTFTNTAEEGVFRNNNAINVVDVQTGEIVHRPPHFEKPEDLIGEYCRFANDKDKQPFFIHPVCKAIILHFLMGYIHPFSDGNGRTARTIFYWYLLKKGYWLIEYMSVSRIILHAKAQYARAYLYTETDRNDLTYFILYSLECMQKALEDLKKYIQRKSAEKKSILSLLRNTSFNSRQISILQEIINDKEVYFSVLQVQTRFGISNQTARNDLNGLSEAGLMELRKNGKKIQFLPVKDFEERIKK